MMADRMLPGQPAPGTRIGSVLAREMERPAGERTASGSRCEAPPPW